MSPMARIAAVTAAASRPFPNVLPMRKAPSSTGGERYGRAIVRPRPALVEPPRGVLWPSGGGQGSPSRAPRGRPASGRELRVGDVEVMPEGPVDEALVGHGVEGRRQ